MHSVETAGSPTVSQTAPSHTGPATRGLARRAAVPPPAPHAPFSPKRPPGQGSHGPPKGTLFAPQLPPGQGRQWTPQRHPSRPNCLSGPVPTLPLPFGGEEEHLTIAEAAAKRKEAADAAARVHVRASGAAGGGADGRGCKRARPAASSALDSVRPAHAARPREVDYAILSDRWFGAANAGDLDSIESALRQTHPGRQRGR
jgi:hypothetical protein